MATKASFEDWRDAWSSYKAQLEHADERLNTYRHLLDTQAEPGNLPKSLNAWQTLHKELLKQMRAHLDRGRRWQLFDAATDLFYEVQLTDLELQARKV